MAQKHTPCTPDCLPIPAFNKMQGKRIVLASASPRRKEILASLGFTPEIVVSNFAEDLPHTLYKDDLSQYPIATAGEKAMEVYTRLVESQPEDAPDLVIAADTVVVYPPIRGPNTRQELGADLTGSEILEKPASPGDNLRMLLNMSGKTCQVVTAVTIVFPIVASPGYMLRSFTTSSLVSFYEHDLATLEAYVESKDGEGKAGGFGIQGLGALLVEKIEGDYNNVVGFPAAPFFKWLEELFEEDEDLLAFE